MDTISDAAELWLRMTVDEFACELANHAIQSSHACKYPSSREATLAMLRQTYLKGRSDAIDPRPDFDADVQRAGIKELA